MSTTAEPVESLDVVEQCAREALEQRGLTVRRVVRVSTESILFLGHADRPMTAWLSRVGTQVREAVTETGFQAEPAAWVVRELGHAPGQRPAPTSSTSTQTSAS